MPDVVEIHVLLLQIAAILLAARICGEIALRLRAPSIIGELCAGILLGPSLLGWITPNDVLNFLAEIGIILLLFEVSRYGLATAGQGRPQSDRGGDCWIRGTVRARVLL